MVHSSPRLVPFKRETVPSGITPTKLVCKSNPLGPWRALIFAFPQLSYPISLHCTAAVSQALLVWLPVELPVISMSASQAAFSLVSPTGHPLSTASLSSPLIARAPQTLVLCIGLEQTRVLIPVTLPGRPPPSLPTLMLRFFPSTDGSLRSEALP